MQFGSMLRYRLFAMHTATRNGFSACTALQARTSTVRRCACVSQRRDISCAASQINALCHQRIQAVATSTEPLQKQRNNGLPPKSTASRKLTFQEAITALERYWAEQSGVNCAILLPHNTEVAQTDCHKPIDKTCLSSSNVSHSLHKPICSAFMLVCPYPCAEPFQQ